VDKYPLLPQFLSEELTSCYNDMAELCQLYKLVPSTVCMFDVIFRHYLVDKVASNLKDYPPPASISSGISRTVLRKFASLKVDALLCLRLAVKLNEKQVDMYQRDVEDPNGGRVCIFQSLCTEILSNMVMVKTDIFGEDFNLAGDALVNQIMDYCACKES